jgi:diguanylate cyclase (GGDEF)-like protein/PAS domain S-box-containing protein
MPPTNFDPEHSPSGVPLAQEGHDGARLDDEATSAAFPDVHDSWDGAHDRLQLAALVFEGTSDGILVTDTRGRIVDVNPAFTRITGHAREQMLGRNVSLLASERHDEAFFRALWSSLLGQGSWQGEIWNRRADGELVAEMLRICTVHSADGEHTHFVGIFSDLSAQKRQQAQLEQPAQSDPLTGLPNRESVLERLGKLVGQAQLTGGRFAVCELDLDGFTPINERLGRAQGDALLMAAAERLRNVVRAGDTVARVGGDEFVLLFGGLGEASTVPPVLERVLQSLRQPFALGGEQPSLSASVGVALYPEHGQTAEQLLRAADQAMYRAKRLGRNRACLAEDETQSPAAQQALLDELRQALRAADQLCLHYQPKVCARTRRCLGVEALLRWQHPQDGLRAPGTFLPAVIGTPLEVELDLWVLRSAVTQLVRWRRAGRGLHMAINVSPATLALPDLAGEVATIVHAIAPNQLVPLEGIELEVLETAALNDLEGASRAIDACARQGISFALDDFGTGYSSLSYLQRLPVSTLKIDRSFVSNMLVNRGDLHIVRAVIGLAEAFSVNTVAEGVETAEHAQALADLGCHQLQGFGIARPMPAPALEAWVDANHAAGACLRCVHASASAACGNA